MGLYPWFMALMGVIVAIVLDPRTIRLLYSIVYNY